MGCYVTHLPVSPPCIAFLVYTYTLFSSTTTLPSRPPVWCFLTGLPNPLVCNVASGCPVPPSLPNHLSYLHRSSARTYGEINSGCVRRRTILRNAGSIAMMIRLQRWSSMNSLISTLLEIKLLVPHPQFSPPSLLLHLCSLSPKLAGFQVKKSSTSSKRPHRY